jgi:hypothetical protein
MRTITLASALVVVLAACSDDPVGPPGSLSVEVNSTGPDRDFIHEIEVAGESYITVGSDVIVEDLRPGTHEVRLEALSSNCTVAGGNTISASVASGERTHVVFNVSCTAMTATIAASATVTGDAPDDVVTVQVGTSAARPLIVGSTIYFEGLAAGNHSVTVGGVAANCTLSGEPTRVTAVTIGAAVRDTAEVAFAIACVEVTEAEAGVELSARKP